MLLKRHLKIKYYLTWLHHKRKLMSVRNAMKLCRKGMLWLPSLRLRLWNLSRLGKTIKLKPFRCSLSSGIRSRRLFARLIVCRRV
jgi:hypothetical protein